MLHLLLCKKLGIPEIIYSILYSLRCHKRVSTDFYFYFLNTNRKRIFFFLLFKVNLELEEFYYQRLYPSAS